MSAPPRTTWRSLEEPMQAPRAEQGPAPLEIRDDPDDEELARARAHVMRLGRHATVWQTLKPDLERWFDDADRGFVAYEATAGYWIAAGNPVAAPDDMADVARAFGTAARRNGARAAFFSADDELIDALEVDDVEHDALPIGEQPEWQPAAYHTRGSDRRSLRSQVNRGRNKGVEIEAIEPAALHQGSDLRLEVEKLIDHWLAGRSMSQMGFLVSVSPFDALAARRFWAARADDGRLVAFLVASPVPQRDGWFFEHILRHRTSPNGTIELLVDTAMRALAEDEARYVSLGLAPLAGVEPGPGEHRVMRAVLHHCYEHLGWAYNFAGLERFKARFAPDRWSTQYLVALDGRVTPWTLHALLSAFSGGHASFVLDSATRLARRTPARLWRRALTAMTLLLVPWTFLLTQVDPVRWFGSDAARDAWVFFDIGMIGGLTTVIVLLWRRSVPLARRLALVLGGLTFGDFILTVHGVATLGLDLEGFAWLPVLGACAGPLFATLLLVGIARLAPLGR